VDQAIAERDDPRPGIAAASRVDGASRPAASPMTSKLRITASWMIRSLRKRSRHGAT
jgi:hypothetical protein